MRIVCGGKGFAKHFKMNEKDAIELMRNIDKEINIFGEKAQFICNEIGDGNLNYVFRIIDTATDKSVIIKQSDVLTRSGQNPLDTDHNRIEAEVLDIQGAIAPGLVPKVYAYCVEMCCVIMEDLRHFENMRHALTAHKIFPHFAEDISGFMADTLIKTTDCVLAPREKKRLVKRFVNPDLCDITERLVYTNPYTDYGKDNILFAPNEMFLKHELYEDTKLRLEVAKLKEQFKTKAQSLLHGDLHTGSVMINQEKTMVIDPEFAFYGPCGYDVGNIVANMIFAWVNAELTMAQGEEKQRFLAWAEETISQIIDLFSVKSMNILINSTGDIMAKTEGFAEWYICDILADAAGVCGLELNRRIIGDSKVSDIADIQNAHTRVLAERICVLCGKALILGRYQAFKNGSDYVDIIKKTRDTVYKLYR
ncbi:MAG: S-methyl-5-thioribose kinase [Oscillospiraceae bacterium]